MAMLRYGDTGKAPEVITPDNTVHVGGMPSKCPKCGSTNLQTTPGTGTSFEVSCIGCKGWSTRVQARTR